MRPSIVRALILSSLFLAVGGRAVAEDAKPAEAPKPTWTFALHGFVGGSVYVQDAALAPSGGGNPMWVSGEYSADKYALGGDIRQSRLNFSIAGPNAFGAAPRGVAEFDLFGGNSSGGFGDVSVFPRIRVAFAELAWPDTTFRVGQDYSLTAGVNTLVGAFLPAWNGHIAFPITYAAGTIGWRYPGIFIYHRLALGGDMKAELALEVARAGWANPANPGAGTVSVTGTAPAGGGSVTSTGTATNPFFSPNSDLGSASALPQVEARAILSVGSLFSAMVAGHWNNVDPTGQGVDPTGNCDKANSGKGCSDFQVVAGTLGLRLNAAGVTFQGSAYIGQNLSPLLGSLVQFPALANAAGDISEWGAWAQLGYQVTPELGFWALVGTEQVNMGNPATTDANGVRTYTQGPIAAGFANLGNVVSQGMIKWMQSGYAFSLEVTHWHTRRVKDALDGNQVMFATNYFF